MLITAREAPCKRRGDLAQTHWLGSLAPAKARDGPIPLPCFLATWRSGYAAACKAVYTGSIPVVASTKPQQPRGLGVRSALRMVSVSRMCPETPHTLFAQGTLTRWHS